LEDFLMAKNPTYEEQGQRAEEVTTQTVKRDPKEWAKNKSKKPFVIRKVIAATVGILILLGSLLATVS